MKFQVHRIFFAFISIVLLTAGGFVPHLFAQCFLTEGLSEEQQTDLARQMFEDGLYQEAWNTSSCYLQEFRSGKSRENMMFLQARASQQAGSLNQALRDLQKFQKNFPGSRKYQEEVLFRKGVVLARMQQYSGALQTLKLLLREYPASKFKDESLYWQGFVTFYRAELIRQETTLKEAVPEFRQVSRQLETLDPENLPEQQAEERLNLLGWAWLFQQNPERSEGYWDAYLKLPGKEDPETALNIKHNLALGFQKKQNYSKASEYFGRVVEEHPKSELAPGASFWRAETRFAAVASSDKKKSGSARIKENKITLDYFRKYQTTGDQQYLPVTNYRMGLLFQQSENNNDAINAFQDYLNHDDSTYRVEVHYRLGSLFQEEDRTEEAIQSFRQHLQGSPDAVFEDVHYRLGLLYQQNGDEENSKKSFQDYLKSGDSQHAGQAHYRLALLYRKQGNLSLAEQQFYEASKLMESPENRAEALFWRAESAYSASIAPLQENSEFELGEKRLLQLDQHYQTFLDEERKLNNQTSVRKFLPLTHFRRGVILELAKKPEDSLAAFQNYLETGDGDYLSEVQYRRGRLFDQRGDHEEAIKSFLAYRESQNKTHSAEVELRLGGLYEKTENFPAAVSALERHLEQVDDEKAKSRIHYQIGILHQKSGRPKLAIQSFETTRNSEQFRNDGPLLGLLASLYRETGQTEKQQELLGSARENEALEPEARAAFQLQLASVQFQEGNCEKLIQEIETLPEKIEPKQREQFLYLRGECFFKLEEWNAAREDLRQIRDVPEYRERSVANLIHAHKELKDWKALTWEYQSIYDQKSPKMSSSDYGLWVYAAHQRKEPKRTEIIYSRWQQDYPEDLQDPDRLLDWARLTDQLDQQDKTGELYEKALQHLDPTSNRLETREFVVINLAELYGAKKQKQKIVPLYEDHLMPFLEKDPKPSEKFKQYASYLGNLCYQELKQIECARKWFQETDGGGASDLELQAVWALSEITEKDQNAEKALEVLQALNQRPISQAWRIRLHYRQGLLLHQLQKWEEANRNFKLVARIPSQNSNELDRIQEASRQQQQEIERFLASSFLNEKLEKQDWEGAATQIRKDVRGGFLEMDENVSELLLSVERRQQNHAGILSAYALIAENNPDRNRTVTALLEQAEAAEKIGDSKRAAEFQQKALDTVPNTQEEADQQQALRIFLSEKRLKKNLENEDWTAVALQIREDVEKGYRELDERQFSYLEAAETESENWEGVLSAYALLRNKYPKRAVTQRALMRQAEAAGKMGNKELEKTLYLKVLALKPASEQEQVQQQQVRRFLSDSELSEKVEASNWSGVALQIRKEIENGERKLDGELFEILLNAEKRQENWSGILDAYELKRQKNPYSAESVTDLMLQAEAAERIKQSEKSRTFYEKALKIPAKNLEERNKQKEILSFLSEGDLQEKIQAEDWAGISKQIRSESQSGLRPLNQKNFDLLVYAETQQKNWSGVLSAFELKKSRDPSSVNTLTALLIQAEAAEKLNEPMRARTFYRKALKVAPRNQEERRRQQEIEKFLSEEQLQKKIENQDWQGIVAQIHKEVGAKKRKLDQKSFDLLIYAETKLENPEGILKAYALLRRSDPKRAGSFNALVHQAQLADQIGKPALVQQYYRALLKLKPADETEREQQESIRNYLAEDGLQKELNQNNWKGVSRVLREQIDSGLIQLDDENFELLISAESEQENWAGILSAYTLLEEESPQKANSLDALLYRAQAAEKLGKIKLSRSFYRKALELTPRNAEEKKKQQEIQNFLSQESLQQKIEKKKWKEITSQIYAELKTGKRKLDEENFNVLLYAEKQKKGKSKWDGILAAYAALGRYQKKSAETIQALLDQGEAAEKLGGRRRAKGYYEKALEKIPLKNVDQRLYVVNQLESLYLREKNYHHLARVYEAGYETLKNQKKRSKELRYFAFQIGYHRLTHLKQPNQARTWLLRADGGGASKSELQAVYWIYQLDRQTGNDEAALKRIREAAGRKIPTSSSWYVLIHYELGTLYHFRENWKLALKHYRFASKKKPAKEVQEYYNTAKERAREIEDYLKSMNQ